jgi:uncharacterized membrane protein YwaF
MMAEELEVSRITIVRSISDAGADLLYVSVEPESLSLVEILGCFSFAADTVIRERMGEDSS